MNGHSQIVISPFSHLTSYAYDNITECIDPGAGTTDTTQLSDLLPDPSICYGECVPPNSPYFGTDLGIPQPSHELAPAALLHTPAVHWTTSTQASSTINGLVPSGYPIAPVPPPLPLVHNTPHALPPIQRAVPPAIALLTRPPSIPASHTPSPASTSTSLPQTESPSSTICTPQAPRPPRGQPPRNVQIGDCVGKEWTYFADLKAMHCLVRGCHQTTTTRRGRKWDKSSLERHVYTHMPIPVACFGVPIEEAAARGVRDLSRPFNYAGKVMVGGCGVTFSRRDAFLRHFKKPGNMCVRSKGQAIMRT